MLGVQGLGFGRVSGLRLGASSLRAACWVSRAHGACRQCRLCKCSMLRPAPHEVSSTSSLAQSAPTSTSASPPEVNASPRQQAPLRQISATSPIQHVQTLPANVDTRLKLPASGLQLSQNGFRCPVAHLGTETTGCERRPSKSLRTRPPPPPQAHTGLLSQIDTFRTIHQAQESANQLPAAGQDLLRSVPSQQSLVIRQETERPNPYQPNTRNLKPYPQLGAFTV